MQLDIFRAKKATQLKTKNVCQMFCSKLNDGSFVSEIRPVGGSKVEICC